MGLHIPHHHIGTPTLAAMPFIEHGIRFADPSRRAQVDTQATTPVWIPTRLRGGLLCRYRCGRGRSFQVAITQAIAPEQLLWIGTSLFALWFIGPILRHKTPISRHLGPG